MTAFSINWPYVAFSGIKNNLVLINAFNRKMIHHIDFGKPEVNPEKT